MLSSKNECLVTRTNVRMNVRYEYVQMYIVRMNV